MCVPCALMSARGLRQFPISFRPPIVRCSAIGRDGDQRDFSTALPPRRRRCFYVHIYIYIHARAGSRHRHPLQLLPCSSYPALADDRQRFSSGNQLVKSAVIVCVSLRASVYRPIRLFTPFLSSPYFHTPVLILFTTRTHALTHACTHNIIYLYTVYTEHFIYLYTYILYTYTYRYWPDIFSPYIFIYISIFFPRLIRMLLIL